MSVVRFPTARKRAYKNPPISHRNPPEGVISMCGRLWADQSKAYDRAISLRPEQTPEMVMLVAMADTLNAAGVSVDGRSFFTSLMARVSSTQPITQQPDYVVKAANVVSDMVMSQYPEAH